MLDYCHPVTQLDLLPTHQSLLEKYHGCQGVRHRLRQYFPSHPRVGGYLSATLYKNYWLGKGGIVYCHDSDSTEWVQCLVPEPAIAVIACDYHAFILTASGRLYAWGINNCGQLGLGHCTGVKVWLLLPLTAPVTSVTTNNIQSLLLTGTGELYGTGRNPYHKEHGDKYLSWYSIPIPTAVAVMAVGNWTSWICTMGGEIYETGRDNLYGVWRQIPHPNSLPVSAMLMGEFHMCIVVGEDTVYAHGDNTYGQLGLRNPRSINNWVKLSLPAPLELLVIEKYGTGFLSTNQRYYHTTGDNECWASWEVPARVRTLAASRSRAVLKTEEGGEIYTLGFRVPGQPPLHPKRRERWCRVPPFTN